MSSAKGRSKREGGSEIAEIKKKKKRSNMSAFEKELLSEVEVSMDEDEEREEEDMERAQTDAGKPWYEAFEEGSPNATLSGDQFIDNVLALSDRAQILIQ